MMDVAFRARAGSGEKLSILQVMKPLRRRLKMLMNLFLAYRKKRGFACLSV